MSGFILTSDQNSTILALVRTSSFFPSHFFLSIYLDLRYFIVFFLSSIFLTIYLVVIYLFIYLSLSYPHRSITTHIMVQIQKHDNTLFQTSHIKQLSQPLMFVYCIVFMKTSINKAIRQFLIPE